MSRRNGVSLIEVIIVIAVLAIMTALLLSAVQKVRESAIRAQSINKLRQISLACHSYSATNQEKLPTFFPNRHFVDIMPFIDGGTDILMDAKRTGKSLNCYAFMPYVSPADPTSLMQKPYILPPYVHIPWGRISYCANNLVYGRENSKLSDVKDGLTNTISYAERYTVCYNSQQMWDLIDGDTFLRVATFADTSKFIDDKWNRSMDDVHPITTGNPPVTMSSQVGRTFQVAPTFEQCNYRLPGTPHKSGMLIALMDGSVRSVHPNIHESAFWSAVTIDAGETMPLD